MFDLVLITLGYIVGGFIVSLVVLGAAESMLPEKYTKILATFMEKYYATVVVICSLLFMIYQLATHNLEIW